MSAIEMYDPEKETKSIDKSEDQEALIKTLQSLAEYTKQMLPPAPVSNYYVHPPPPTYYGPSYTAPSHYYPPGPYIHPQRSQVYAAPVATPYSFVANQMCREYSRKGKCQFESTCRWFHVHLPSRICYTFLLKDTCNDHEHCRFTHMSSRELYEYMETHHSSLLKQVEARQYKY